MAKLTHEAGNARYSVSLWAYDNHWNSTDQVPLRAVAVGPDRPLRLHRSRSWRGDVALRADGKRRVRSWCRSFNGAQLSRRGNRASRSRDRRKHTSGDFAGSSGRVERVAGNIFLTGLLADLRGIRERLRFRRPSENVRTAHRAGEVLVGETGKIGGTAGGEPRQNDDCRAPQEETGFFSQNAIAHYTNPHKRKKHTMTD